MWRGFVRLLVSRSRSCKRSYLHVSKRSASYRDKWAVRAFRSEWSYLDKARAWETGHSVPARFTYFLIGVTLSRRHSKLHCYCNRRSQRVGSGWAPQISRACELRVKLVVFESERLITTAVKVHQRSSTDAGTARVFGQCHLKSLKV